MSRISKTFHFQTIDSTNTWAKKHADEWAKEGITVISTDFQTQGRGRLSRVWISPPSTNIMTSFCFWLDSEKTDFVQLPQILALTTVEVLLRKGLFPQIKWPNDVLIHGKKIAGILTEALQENERRGMILGIGLNVNMTPETLLSIDRPATSLFVETGIHFSLKVLQQELEETFASNLSLFFQEGFSPFFSSFKKFLTFKKGDLVTFHDHQKVIEATFEAIQIDGSIALRLASGEIRTYHAGEFL